MARRAHAMLRFFVVASAAAVVVEGSAAPPSEELRAFMTARCLDCHGGSARKGELDLGALLERWAPDPSARPPYAGDSDAARWLLAARRLESGEMPPRSEPPPPGAESEGMIALIREAFPEHDTRARSAAVRRLTRGEYERAVRDLFGVAVELGERLPSDDPGNGFDVSSDALNLSPLAVERYLGAAERVADSVAPSEAAWRTVRLYDGPRLERAGQGGLIEGAQMLYASGRISAKWNADAGGRYRIRVRAWGQQAGPDPVRLAIRLDPRRTLAHADVPNERGDPLVIEHECEVPAGERRIDVVFLNDYWRPEEKDPRKRDRNAAVESIEVEGPLDPPPLPPALGTAPGAEPEEARVRDFVRRTARRAYRRPVEEEEVAQLLETAGAEATPRARLNGALAAILASPSFLIRADAALPGDFAIASRLASFLWSSVPDAALLAAAAEGRLAAPGERASAARRMLADPRSRSLAEEFATQWLAVREIDRRMPDPTRFPDVDAPLLASMREETIRWFDRILRERRPIGDLIESDWSVMNERLMRHCGVAADASLEAPDHEGWRRVRVEPGGVLRQSSIMVATSNPTRTSPVKRGRFVLASLLDAAPPPPPPGVPQLPPEAEDHDAPLAAHMARHRADPSCAACHRSMDSIGLLLERFDAVGRPRTVHAAASGDEGGAEGDPDHGASIEVELPDGRVVRSLSELHGALLEESALTTTLARRLLVFATGRSLTPRSREACDRLAASLGAGATLADLVAGIVELDAFVPRHEGAVP